MNAISEASSPATPVRPAHKIASWLPWVVLSVLWLLLIKQLWLEWSTDESYSYGYVVPLLSLYLFSRRWMDRPGTEIPGANASTSQGWLFALLALPALLLLPIRIVQESNPEWHYVSWCMAASVICLTLGLMAYRAGWRWAMHFAFPVAFIFTAVHWPTFVEGALINRLTKIDTGSAVFLLNWLGIPAIQNGNVIEAAGNMIGVNEACSGIRSLQITVMISLFFGEYHRFRWVRRLALFLLVAVVALACNLGRTFLLVWLSVHHGNAVMEKWHDTVGFAVLVVALAAFWGLATLMDATRSRPQPVASSRTAPDRFRPWPGIFIIAMAAWLVFIETATELWYRSHESSTPTQPAWTVNWPKNAPGFKEQPIPDESRAMLKYTTGRHAIWRDENDFSWSVFFFQWAPGRTSAILARMHRPETCLPSIGCILVRGDAPRVVKVNGITILIHDYLFDEGGRSLHVWWALWDGAINPVAFARPDRPNAPDEIIRTAFQGQRNLGQQVIELAVTGADNDADANAALDGLLPKLIKR